MGVNALLSSIRTLSTIIFPLITYPYITKTLSVSNIGKINFSQSIISYFTLIAQFGISTFAIRTGARIRDDKIAFEKFAKQVFTINIISTLVSIILLTFLLILPTQLANYRIIIAILSINVILIPISMDWIYTIYEDFGYITLRSILVSLLSLILMFCFVKTNADTYLYVALITMSTSLGSIFNFLHVHKYVILGITRRTNWKKYRTSLFMFFINSVTSTIYLNSDITLLGFMSTNTQVGLYSVATKIYGIAKQMINAVIATTIPRLAYIQKKDEKQFKQLLNNIMNMAIFLVVPLMAGLIMVRKDVILIISTPKYSRATESLAILSLALFFSVLANILANGLLVVINKEKYVVVGTTTSAIVNLLLNFIFIPWWGQNGAALTTLIAEGVMLGVSAWATKEYLKDLFDVGEIIRVFVGTIIMFLVTNLISVVFNSNIFLNIVETVIVAVVIYFISMLIMRDKVFISVIKLIKLKLS